MFVLVFFFFNVAARETKKGKGPINLIKIVSLRWLFKNKKCKKWIFSPVLGTPNYITSIVGN